MREAEARELGRAKAEYEPLRLTFVHYLSSNCQPRRSDPEGQKCPKIIAFGNAIGSAPC
jgi:hypothetical protein